MTPKEAAPAAGHVGLGHDQEFAAPGGSLRGLIEETLGEVFGPLPPFDGGRPTLVTQMHIVDPPFYGNGDIGQAAVCATVNELAAAGATPLGLTLSVIVEAGMPFRQVRRMAGSVRDAAADAGVVVSDVDVRVVRAGEADQMYLHTTGFGVFPQTPSSPAAAARAGDLLVVSGPIGAYGAHILSVRRSLGHEGVVSGECTPLNGLLDQLRNAVPAAAVRSVHPVGRGGLAGVLLALAAGTGLGVQVDERELPVWYEVRVALDALGVDPVHAATANCLCLVVAPEAADQVLAALHAHPRGREAVVVGEVLAQEDGAAGGVTLVRAAGPAVPLVPETSPAARLS
ncbi:AIR synthase-related protein [Streptomyces sp. TBY4]|uniref:AIR synthase-related protein n=1 Tax=Streptomyces sp. TBY4 TaxID=2962030 RepID=UPI0020B7CB1E|nr:AIR synthase-related protein [Streptomyces sp. TBY4]MCP3760591.1 AIR synthase-related protein [Streptomyces sp. TBY4]